MNRHGLSAASFGLRLSAEGSVVGLLGLDWVSIPRVLCRRRWLYQLAVPYSRSAVRNNMPVLANAASLDGQWPLVRRGLPIDCGTTWSPYASQLLGSV